MQRVAKPDDWRHIGSPAVPSMATPSPPPQWPLTGILTSATEVFEPAHLPCELNSDGRGAWAPTLSRFPAGLNR